MERKKKKELDSILELKENAKKNKKTTNKTTPPKTNKQKNSIMEAKSRTFLGQQDDLTGGNLNGS